MNKGSDNMYVKRILYNCITGRTFTIMDKNHEYQTIKQHDTMWHESWGEDNKIRISSHFPGTKQKTNRYIKCKKYKFKRSNNGKEYYGCD